MESPEKIPENIYNQLVLKKCEDNHIWLNKITYAICPTNEEKIALADMILEKLRAKDAQIPSRGITDDIDIVRQLAILTPELYLRINWS